MADLESDLRALANTVAFPPTPNLAAAVGETLRKSPRRSVFRRRRRVLVAALAVLLLAVAVSLAVPPARTALLELFRLGGVSVERVDRLPPVAPRGQLRLGLELTLADARRRAAFPVRLPDAERYGEPDAVFFSDAIPGGRVSLLYGTHERIRLLVTEFRGQTDADLVKKAARPATRLDVVTVGMSPGFWLEGAPHAVLFRDETGSLRADEYRLAGNVLVWVEGSVTYRLEGDLDLEDAKGIAESFR